MDKILYRPIIAFSLVLATLVIVEFLALGSITWLNLNRIDKIKQYIIQEHDIEYLVYDIINAPVPKSTKPEQINLSPEIHNKIKRVLASPKTGDQKTDEYFEEIKPFLQNFLIGTNQDLKQFFAISEKIINQQRSTEKKLLSEVYEDSRLKLYFAIVIPVIVLLPTFLFGISYFRKNIMSPLISLEQLIKRLTDGEMRPIEYRKDHLMQPLFSSYNRLISRLAELESEHKTYTQRLESEIRSATHTLLEQSYTLARSERLAAVGELAARAAHELRNPLAGILAALDNMFRECNDPEISKRLPLVSAEVKRMTVRLNDLLAQSKQRPEEAKVVDVSKIVTELLTLFKYQINENITLTSTFPPDLMAKLPETEFRQALLNLLLNSVQELDINGGTVNLSINKDAETLNIEVRDNGRGFPKALLENGIKPYSSYREQGTGLGLAMVLRFVRSLDGQLKIKNNDQGHASAILELPYLT